MSKRVDTISEYINVKPMNTLFNAMERVEVFEFYQSL